MSSAVMPAAVSVNRNPIQQRRSALHPSLSAGRELVQGAQRCCDLAHIGKEACPEIHSLVVDECSGRQQWANSNSPKTEQSARLPCMLPGDRDAEMIKIQSKINENLLRVPRHCSYPVDLPALTLSLMLSARVGEGGTSGFFLRHGQTIEAVRPRGEEQLASVYRFDNDVEDTKLLTILVFYGLILLEYRVVNFASTKLVILSALIPQIFWRVSCRLQSFD